MAPSVIRARARRCIGSRRKFSAVERIFPTRRAVSIILVQPRTVTARGFSHRTCSPASRQAIPTAWCKPLSTVTSAACRSGQLPHGVLDGGEDARPVAEQLLGLVRQQLGLLPLDVHAAASSRLQKDEP